jgi:hypothetical protein
MLIQISDFFVYLESEVCCMDILQVMFTMQIMFDGTKKTSNVVALNNIWYSNNANIIFPIQNERCTWTQDCTSLRTILPDLFVLKVLL